HEDLGKLGCAKQSNRAFDGGCIEVGPGFTTTTEHEMSVGIAGGFQDSRGAFLGERRKKVSAARGPYPVHSYLDVTVCTVLDADRHRQPRPHPSWFLLLPVPAPVPTQPDRSG